MATPQKTFLIFQDNNYTYDFVRKQINKMAHACLALGMRKGDVVAIMMHNEPTYIWTHHGVGKLGVEPALINYNLRNKSLVHSIAVSGAKTLILGQGDDLMNAIKDIQSDLKELGVRVLIIGAKNADIPDEFRSIDTLFNEASTDPVSRIYREGVTYSSTMCYIFTSGTTGLPKAAVVTHAKGIKGTLLMQSANVRQDDIFYTPLPLYHSAANLIALGSVIATGGTLVLRNKFSASNFWDDCRRHNVTVIQYIGELCRYLCAQPKSPQDGSHSVRVAFGNGLRPDVWTEFKERFKIPFVGEFYAATEGNAGFINHYNKMGSVGRSSPFMRYLYPTHFLKYDQETEQPVRDSRGLCIPAEEGEPGLLAIKIKRDFTFEGYKGSEDLNQKKIIENVFRHGDKYFNSGDLLTADKEFYLYFHDRIGDTFRWKGENVSTIEVSNTLSDLPWLEDANVYGVTVPGQDGRAGMAALTLSAGQSLTADRLGELFRRCEDLLPTYARPRFLRIVPNMTITSTFKQKKVELVKEGFDLERCKPDAVYINDPSAKGFVPLTEQHVAEIRAGTLRL